MINHIQGPRSLGNPRVARLRKILGDDVLLLPWPKGSKGTAIRWGHLTAADMDDPKHATKLERGNIGVALGAVSGGLISIDFDDDDLRDAFFAANPALASSLITRGNRGCNVWLRIAGPYPPACKLRRAIKTRFEEGDDHLGEWRSDGNYTIIDGIHPLGMPYTVVNHAAPVVVEFADIVWPTMIKPPRFAPKTADSSFGSGCYTVDAVDSVDSVDAADPVDPSRLSLPQRVEVAGFVPKKPGQSDAMLWRMARRLLTVEKNIGRDTSKKERGELVAEWYRASVAVIDPALAFEDYYWKWFRALDSVRHPDDETPLDCAWRQVEGGDWPRDAKADYGIPISDKMRQLIALCFHLQCQQGDEPFFLSARDAGERLGVSAMSANRYLSILCEQDGPMPLLREIQRGNLSRRLATEYVFARLISMP